MAAGGIFSGLGIVTIKGDTTFTDNSASESGGEMPIIARHVEREHDDTAVESIL